MDCRETQALLSAFHDGELPDADRARVADHLRGCPECGARLADLARVDAAAGVPDPGPAYWDRFNARVMERVEREAEGPKAVVLRPKRGWVRQQLRYLVPAAAAAAMVVGVVRYGGLHPGAPTTAMDGRVPGQAGMPRVLQPRPPATPPAGPPAVREPAAPLPAEGRAAKAVRESLPTARRAPAAVARRVPEETNRVAEAPAATSSVLSGERSVAAPRVERDRSTERPMPDADERGMQDRAAAPAGIASPSPPPATTYRSPTTGSPPAASTDGMASRVQGERKKMAESAPGAMAAKERTAEAHPAADLGKTRSKDVVPRLAAEPPHVESPCELARTLADRKRWKEAEAAQRKCLAQDRSAPVQERGLVFLAELLDRQERFADADAVIDDVDRQFPRSRPLDLYRQQRPMVQKRPMEVPVVR